MLASIAPAGLTNNTSTVNVPIKKIGTLTTVEVSIANKQYLFAIDTGTPDCIVTDQVADEALGEGLAKKKVLISIDKAQSFRKEADIIRDSKGSPVEHLNIDGILGMSFFNGLVFRLDYKNMRLTISANQANIKSIPGMVEHPIVFKDGLLPVYEKEGKDYLLDTGSSAILVPEMDSEWLKIWSLDTTNFAKTTRRQYYLVYRYSTLQYEFTPALELNKEHLGLFPNWKPDGILPANYYLSPIVQFDFVNRRFSYLSLPDIERRLWSFVCTMELPIDAAADRFRLDTSMRERRFGNLQSFVGWNVVSIGDETASEIARMVVEYDREQYEKLARIVERRERMIVVIIEKDGAIQRLKIEGLGKPKPE